MWPQGKAMRWSLLWNVMDSCTTRRFEMSLIKDRAAIVHMHCTGCWSHAKLVSPRPVRVTESGAEDHQHRAMFSCFFLKKTLRQTAAPAPAGLEV